MQKVEAYRASDGALFATAEGCQTHEMSLLWRARIAEFMTSKFCPYTRPAHAKMAMNIVIAWEQFKETHKGTEPETVDVDKPARATKKKT